MKFKDFLKQEESSMKVINALANEVVVPCEICKINGAYKFIKIKKKVYKVCEACSKTKIIK